MPEVNEILKERGSRYGAFAQNAGCAYRLKGLIREWQRGNPSELSPDMQEALDLICTKISRIVTGDPSYVDNWDDIAGYASLISKRLRGEAI